MGRRVPDEPEVLQYFTRYSNWGKWGPEDELGTINYITPDVRKRAAGLVKEGFSVGCSRPIVSERAPDAQNAPMHHMLGSGERWAGKDSPPEEIQSAADFIGMAYQGFTITHLDSLAHVFWKGKMYNGYPADMVTVRAGATKESVTMARDGIVSRGVLLDVARTKGVKWLDPGQGVFPEDLEEAERASGVKVQGGDILLLRTGNLRRRQEEGPRNLMIDGYPGYHAASIPWLHERQVAVLGADSPTDVRPSGYRILQAPLHQVGIVGLGLWTLDNANLEELAVACERYGRWEFLFTIAPLRVEGGTGSPVNPIAMF